MPVTLGLYDGADGPTLRIDTQTREELDGVLSVLESLASGTTEEIDFLRVIEPTLDGVSSLLMSRSAKRQSRTLVAGPIGPQGTELRWRGDREYWLECLEKAQALLEDSTPAHQYFTGELYDAAVIELCYLETPPQV